jgi:hypothetical protein
MRILIAGDSFAADWQVKYPNQKGWVNLLAEKYDVTNIAQAAVSEYKILKQIHTVDFSQYNSVIISHASPNRVHCAKHPIHSNDPLHKNSDLIYADLLDQDYDKDVQTAINYFERYVDLDYYKDISDLICMEILNILGSYEHLNQFHLTNYSNNVKYDFLPSYNVNKIFSKHRGLINHFDDQGNQLLYNIIDTWLQDTV